MGRDSTKLLNLYLVELEMSFVMKHILMLASIPLYYETKHIIIKPYKQRLLLTVQNAIFKLKINIYKQLKKYLLISYAYTLTI